MEKPEDAENLTPQPQDFSALMKSVAEIVEAVLANQPMALPSRKQSRWKRARQLQGGIFPLWHASGGHRA